MKLHFPGSKPGEGMYLHGENAIKYHPFEKYNPKKDRNKPAMFWLYYEDDYKALINHTGKKIICWHGSDVIWFYKSFQKYINLIRDPAVTHVFLNYVTQAEMFRIGVYGVKRYIFWADPAKFTPQTGLTKDAYIVAKKGNEEIYGECIVNSLAWKYPEWTFHIFGCSPTVPVYCDNVKYYGWIPEDEMDEITLKFGCCIRHNVHDGFPQIVCKSLLREQYVLTQLPYDKLTIEYNSPNMLMKAFDCINKEIEVGKTFENNVKGMINNFDFI
jgi:hypothetical protein